MSPASAKFKKSISLLFILNLGVWLVAGSKLENPDWNMWIDKDDGHLSNKRITAKSVFIAPQISKCSEGFRLDQLGKCVKITTVNNANQWQFYLDKLNMMFGKKPEANAVVGGSEPFKVNIPLFGNNQQEDKNKKINGTIRPDVSSQKVEITTRKQPHFTELFNMQTTFTTNGKTEYPSTTTNSPVTESSTKTEAWSTSTKLMPESTTELRDRFETVMWITEKPKREQTVNKTATNANKSQTNTSWPSTTEGNFTTDSSREHSTLLSTTQTPPLFDKLGSTVEHFSTLDANVDTVNPSSLPPPTIVDNTKTTFIPTSHNTEFFNADTTLEQFKLSTIQSDKPSTVLSSSTTTTTDAPFLIIVTDTNNHIVNTNENEPSVETDYILISNSSSHLTNVNNHADTAEKISHTKTKSDVQIVDKMCIDSELCNDEIVLPYFESTKTIRNDGSKIVSNSSSQSKSDEHSETSTSSENVVKKQIENNKITNTLQNIKYEETGTGQQVHSAEGNVNIDLLASSIKLNPSSTPDDKFSLDSSHIYESLKMPPSSPSSIDLSVKSDSKKKSESSTVQTLVNIVHPTSTYYSSTSAYNPKKSPLLTATTQSYSPIKKSVPATSTTQRSPTLTTTKRIFTHGQSQNQPNPYTPDSNVYNLMYSLQPASVDYNANSNEYLFGSSSSYMEPQYASYDSSSYVRFPSDQQAQYKQHPNSKFSLDFANTFGADGTSNVHPGASNSFIRFPTISRTPASTFNSNQWSNTRWPPHQTAQGQSAPLDNTWNSRWPLHQPQQQSQQQYYNQNSRYQQNYKMLQI